MRRPEQFELQNKWLVGLTSDLRDERYPQLWFRGRAKFVQEVLDVWAESIGIHHLGENRALGAKHR